ncbi:MAG TPA: hypothetical protein VM328_11295 [Fimbriimonadaceae bacterium]|nr:hypothetical protein [Fimbriimonadaceae bacterium]
MIDRLELHALADGELEGAERQRVSERIANCEESAAEFQAIMRLKQVVAEKCHAPSYEESWQECRGRLAEIDSTRRIESFVGRYAWALCSMFLVFILGAGILNRSAADGLRAGDVPAMMSSLSSVGSAAPGEAREWIRKEGGVATSLESVRTFQVIDRAVGLHEGHKVLAVRLRDDVGDFAVLVVPGARVVDGVAPVSGRSDLSSGTLGRASCVTWQEGPVALILTGDRRVDELCELADALRGVQR